jgi:hypothetical protein
MSARKMDSQGKEIATQAKRRSPEKTTKTATVAPSEGPTSYMAKLQTEKSQLRQFPE